MARPLGPRRAYRQPRYPSATHTCSNCRYLDIDRLPEENAPWVISCIRPPTKHMYWGLARDRICNGWAQQRESNV